MNQVKIFHLTNKYIVDVVKTDKGCISKFPANYFISPEIHEMQVEYVLHVNGISAVSSSSSRQMPLQECLRRPVIILDIALKLEQRQIHPELVLSFDGVTPKKKVLEILSGPSLKEEKAKEKIILQNLSKILLNKVDFETMNNIGMGDYYNFCVRIINEGGFV